VPISEEKSPPPILEFKDVDTFYGELHVLKRVNYRVDEGAIVCLLGGNASGKSTTMKTILGIVRPASGAVQFGGERIDRLPTQAIVTRGISLVPEARRLFGRISL